MLAAKHDRIAAALACVEHQIEGQARFCAARMPRFIGLDLVFGPGMDTFGPSLEILDGEPVIEPYDAPTRPYNPIDTGGR